MDDQSGDSGGKRGSRSYKRCPYCAEDILEEAIVCRYCGRDLPEGNEKQSEGPKPQIVEEVASIVPATVEEAILKCPNCSRTDSIAKVSAIYSAGTSSGSYSGPTTSTTIPFGKGQTSFGVGYATLSGSSQTELSRKLAPPGKPIASGTSILAIASAAGACLLGSCGWTVVVDQISVSSSGMPPGAMIVIGYLAVLAVAIAIIISARNSANDRERQNLKEVSRWEMAVARWNNLYYCASDDGVFDPDSGKWVPINRMNQLLTDYSASTARNVPTEKTVPEFLKHRR